MHVRTGDSSHSPPPAAAALGVHAALAEEAACPPSPPPWHRNMSTSTSRQPSAHVPAATHAAGSVHARLRHASLSPADAAAAYGQEMHAPLKAMIRWDHHWNLARNDQVGPSLGPCHNMVLSGAGQTRRPAQLINSYGSEPHEWKFLSTPFGRSWHPPACVARGRTVAPACGRP